MIRDQIHKMIDDVFDLHCSLVAWKRFPEARGHFRSARREVLLGLRSVLDSALVAMEKPGADDQLVRVPVVD
jgi:hypothetical protein